MNLFAHHSLDNILRVVATYHNTKDQPLLGMLWATLLPSYSNGLDVPSFSPVSTCVHSYCVVHLAYSSKRSVHYCDS